MRQSFISLNRLFLFITDVQYTIRPRQDHNSKIKPIFFLSSQTSFQLVLARKSTPEPKLWVYYGLVFPRIPVWGTSKDSFPWLYFANSCQVVTTVRVSHPATAAERILQFPFDFALKLRNHSTERKMQK